MKIVKYIGTTLLLVVVASGSLTSCATTMKVNQEEAVFSYTLKNKKELMMQKIANKKPKTLLATP